MRDSFQSDPTTLQLVSEPRRLGILQLIWEEERSAGQIAERFPVSFSAISQHLARLRDAGLVEVRKEGRQRYYRARKSAFGSLAVYLESLWARRLEDLKRMAEAEERGNA